MGFPTSKACILKNFKPKYRIPEKKQRKACFFIIQFGTEDGAGKKVFLNRGKYKMGFEDDHY